ncbi:5-oxoprolinase subunit PxpA [Agromyces sp. CFH 90414]|uniref:5-oxoprolinase subunit A n=1 Tax=Agromyces agglutinans TaxID=2662258 RepID=A0A6I2FE61_9MICO|nr:5-oxoprolinase subunit PxpA [Agromyces agglutinans]MRG60183.1 5-oxoprolinase subunit PxpA [Agromyces agglutinans]
MDLNSDLGEAVGDRLVADDAAMFPLVTSANVACGFHAGDPVVMRSSVALALANGVVLGAHPGYRDLDGFGRRELGTPPETIAAELLAQVGALDAIARAAGARVAYVKAHGALYHRLGRDPEAAAAYVDAIAALDDSLVLLGAPGTALEARAAEAGLRFAREAFADRGYLADGSLVPRGEPGAVETDAGAVADRAVELATTGAVTAVDGSRVELAADSICLHGDTPGAVELASRVRAALAAAGVDVRAFA